MGRHIKIGKNLRDMNNITKTRKTLIGNLFSDYSELIRNLQHELTVSFEELSTISESSEIVIEHLEIGVRKLPIGQY